jgi:hypothetical protein
MSQKMTLMNLFAYALSTLSSHPILPRWIQDITGKPAGEENPLAQHLIPNNYIDDAVPIQIHSDSEQAMNRRPYTSPSPVSPPVSPPLSPSLQ